MYAFFFVFFSAFLDPSQFGLLAAQQQSQFTDPAIMSARFSSPSELSYPTERSRVYGAPPGLSYPQVQPHAQQLDTNQFNHGESISVFMRGGRSVPSCRAFSAENLLSALNYRVGHSLLIQSTTTRVIRSPAPISLLSECDTLTSSPTLIHFPFVVCSSMRSFSCP